MEDSKVVVPEPLTKQEIEALREFLNQCIYAPPGLPGEEKLGRWYEGLGLLVDQAPEEVETRHG